MVLSAPGAIAISWICVAIAGSFLGTRLYVRYWLQRCLTMSDGCLLLAFLIFLYLMVEDVVLWRLGQWEISLADADAIHDARKRIPNENELRRILKILWSAGPLYYLSLWLVKAAFIIFYYTFITRAFKILRFALNTVAFLTFFGFIAGEAMSLFYCIPVSRNWALDNTFCSSFSKPPAYYLMMAVHFFSDAAIYTLPFFVLPYLRLTYRQKVGISLVFALGSLTILASVARVLVVGTAFNQASVNALSAVEMCTGISVASTPPLKWLFTKKRRESNAAGMSDGSRSKEPSAQRSKRRERERERGRMRQRDGEMEWGTFMYNLKEGNGDGAVNEVGVEGADDEEGYHDFMRGAVERNDSRAGEAVRMDDIERVGGGNKDGTVKTDTSTVKGSVSPTSTEK